MVLLSRLKPTLSAYQRSTKVTVTTEGAALSPTTLARVLLRQGGLVASLKRGHTEEGE